MHPLVERIDARLNPLMVKEAHQSFRNRSLLLMGALVLGIPLLIFMGSAASHVDGASDLGPDNSGETFFRTLSGFVLFVTWFGVPARLAAQYHGEIRSRTIELTMLTGLTPWQLASGRFQAGALQVLLLLAFVGPFAVASIAMGGIGADRVLPELLLIFVVAMMQCAGMLLLVSATLLAPRLLALFALVGLFELFAVASIGVSFTAMAAGAASGLELVLWSAMMLVITAFFVRLAADMLAPAGMRTFLRSKLLMVAVLALYCGLPLLGHWLSLSFAISNSDEEPFLFMACIWLCGFGLLWCGAERRRGSAGNLGLLLEDGPGPTTLFVCALLYVLALGAQRAGWDAWIVVAFLVYFVMIVGGGALLQSLWFTRSAEGFFIGVLVVIALDLVATFLVAAESAWNISNRPSPATVLLPFVWSTTSARVFSAWSFVPLLLGLASLLWVRLRQRTHRHG